MPFSEYHAHSILKMKLITILLVPFILGTPAFCQARVKLANLGTIAFDCGRMPGMYICKDYIRFTYLHSNRGLQEHVFWSPL